MEAKELRIGNLVYAVGGIDIMPVLRLQDGAVHLVTPIPLTDDFLAGCDFIQKDVGGGIVFYFPDNEWYFIDRVADNGWCSLYCSGVYCATDIKYVHQLQNLYFALTGEELKINL